MGEQPISFWPLLDRLLDQLCQGLEARWGCSSLQPPTVVVAEAEPVRCLAAILAGWQTGATVVLANPHWGQREWQQVDMLLQPNRRQPLLPNWKLYLADIPCAEPQSLLIATGGTSGQIKFARHTWTTLMASVQGFQAHFQIATVNAYCVLPLYHVSGFMQALRTLTTSGQLILQPYAKLKQGSLLPLPAENSGFLSLVPTQLQELLNQGNAYLPWLRQFQAILLGGAPPWPALLAQARSCSIPLAPTYGMTETASQIATLHPAEFLAGQTGSGRILPHATVQILNDQGQPQPPNTPGRLAITAQSLCHGYLAHPPSGLSQASFLTDDLGYLDSQGYLHLLGRHSTTLITGGEKVQPEELEALLLVAGLVQAVCVVGIPDSHWGQAVCALVVPKPQLFFADLAHWLAPRVVSYKRPKYWVCLENLPQSAQGKINRHAALALATAILQE